MENEIKLNPGIVNNDKFGNKDFEKYAYFVSKASNHTVIIKPQLEEIMANGEVKVSRDEKGKEMLRVMAQFNNGMLRIEYAPVNEFTKKADIAKAKMNKLKIDYLRMLIQKELELSENKKSIKEVKKAPRLYTEEEVANLMEAQNQANNIEKTGKKEDNNGNDVVPPVKK